MTVYTKPFRRGRNSLQALIPNYHKGAAPFQYHLRWLSMRVFTQRLVTASAIGVVAGSRIDLLNHLLDKDRQTAKGLARRIFYHR